ncbi:hypothetical protein C8J56DRAFT_778858 [Mycena floridula]|nr:hypothetical protein C8J56DRAFT_778858 [Mycena floridula]
MAAVNPSAIPLPEILNPILEFIESNIPRPVYSVLISFLSHALALSTALLSLIMALLSTHPLQWDAQTVLPPVIALLSAYLALVSLYRTATWTLRVGFWFMKWGTVLGALIAGAAWIMGTANNAGADLTSFGVLSAVGGAVADLIKGQGLNDGQPRSSARRPKARKSRPKAWNSFAEHKEWQNAQKDEGEVARVLQDVLASAEQAVKDSAWWSTAQSILGLEDPEQKEKQNKARKGSTSR